MTTGLCNGGILLVRNRETGKKLIEKKIEGDAVRAARATDEIEILKQLRNGRYITELISSYIDSDLRYASLWLEYCELGNLDDLIRRHAPERDPVYERFLWKVFQQIAEAVRYCHYGNGSGRWHKIVHRDIKQVQLPIPAYR